MKLTLSEAPAAGRLPEFIAQQENESAVSASRNEFDALVKKAVKSPPPQVQTSSSPARDSSVGKKTR